MLAISGITYTSVAVFCPKPIETPWKKDLAAVSESLKTELESYASIEEAENFLEFFKRNNQASVTVLDKEEIRFSRGRDGSRRHGEYRK